MKDRLPPAPQAAAAQRARQPPRAGGLIPAHLRAESLRREVNVKRVFAGSVRCSDGSVSSSSLCTAARVLLLSWRLGWVEEPSSVPVCWLCMNTGHYIWHSKVRRGVGGMAAHAFWGTLNRSSPKLRHQENVKEQLVRGCHYHLSCGLVLEMADRCLSPFEDQGLYA